MKSKTPSTKEETQIQQHVEMLRSDDGLKRKQAREFLVKNGSKSLPFIVVLLDSEKHKHRWEAMKVIAEISSPDSIPLLLNGLVDESGDIRWIASEGLIRVGKFSIKPILELITDKHDSVFVLNGAHHVISELNTKNLLPDDFPTKKLLRLLRVSGNPSNLKILVHNILANFDDFE
jgi:HEAT repeat protein